MGKVLLLGGRGRMGKHTYMCQKHERAILGFIVGLGLAFRLYGINAPLVDSHQIRQAQTAMMTRNLYEDNMNVFRTRLDFFGNSPGYVLMEFPLMHGITALLYYLFGVHEMIGRLVNVGFSIGAMFLMYGLARKFLSHFGSMATLALYTMSPFNIYFSRAFMPESSMLFFSIGAIYYSLKWLEDKRWHLYVGSIVFTALACLSKPTAGLILVPIVIAWFCKWKWNILRRIDFWVYIMLALGPFVAWATYAHYANSMNPDLPAGFGGNWLEVITGRGNILAHWISPKFYIYLGGSIILFHLTPLGFTGFVWGILCARRSNRRVVLDAWLGANVVYFYALAGPNSGHAYYQLTLQPVAVIYFGFAAEWLLSKSHIINHMFERRSLSWWGGGLLFMLTIAHGIGYFKFYSYMYDTKLRMPYALEVAGIVKENTNEDRAIILNQPCAVPAVVTYYAECKTWYFRLESDEMAIEELENLRTHGATTYVAIDTKYGSGVTDTEQHEMFYQYLRDRYRPVALSEHYLIYDLRDPKT